MLTATATAEWNGSTSGFVPSPTDWPVASGTKNTALTNATKVMLNAEYRSLP